LIGLFANAEKGRTDAGNKDVERPCGEKEAGGETKAREERGKKVDWKGAKAKGNKK
jgi:hypothetical protein